MQKGKIKKHVFSRRLGGAQGKKKKNFACQISHFSCIKLVLMFCYSTAQHAE